MKKQTKNLLIIGAVILGGGYLLSKYFTPKRIADTITDYGIKKIAAAPGELYKQQQVLTIPYNQELPFAREVDITEKFVNISAIITRINPFTRPVSPLIDWSLTTLSKNLKSLFGG